MNDTDWKSTPVTLRSRRKWPICSPVQVLPAWTRALCVQLVNLSTVPQWSQEHNTASTGREATGKATAPCKGCERCKKHVNPFLRDMPREGKRMGGVQTNASRTKATCAVNPSNACTTRSRKSNKMKDAFRAGHTPFLERFPLGFLVPGTE